MKRFLIISVFFLIVLFHLGRFAKTCFDDFSANVGRAYSVSALEDKGD